MYKIIIPAYNEESVIYNTLKSNLKHASEIVVIDDRSTDKTWSEIKRFSKDFPTAKIKKVRMKSNGKKVLSIKSVLKALPHSIKYIILLDADSTLHASQTDLVKACKKLEENNFGAASFKIMVKNKDTILGKIFDIESHIREFLNSFVSKCYKLRCVPGGGSVFKRAILENALKRHSGEFFGEDLETTAIVMENEHKIGYFPKIVSKTIVPSTILNVLKQRIRWEAGAMRVYIQKLNFYLENFLEFNRYSFLWLLEIMGWMLFPFFLFGVLTNPTIFPFSYLGSVGYVKILTNDAKHDKNFFLLVLIYPMFYLILVSMARIMALSWLIKYYYKR